MSSHPARPPRVAVLDTHLAGDHALVRPAILAGLRAGQAPRLHRAAARGPAGRLEDRPLDGEPLGWALPADAA